MTAIGGRVRAGWDGWAIGLAVFLFHLCHVPAIARSAMFRIDNLPFDFDVRRFVSLWGVSPFEVEQNAAYYAVRHPLAIAPRLLGRPLVASGIEPGVAAGAIAALCAALSSVLALRIARALGVNRPLAWVLTALWSCSATSLLLGVLPEAYGLALVALSWQMLIAIRWAQGDEPALPVRIAAAVASFGITVTNVVLSGLVEIACRLARQPVRQALSGTAGFVAAVGAIGMVLGAASFQLWPVDRIGGSGGAAKQIYWAAASANEDSKHQSPAGVAWTFGAVAFVAPAVARYPSGDAVNPYLYDLRGTDYGPAGTIAVIGWLALLALGVAAAARDRALRPFWIVAAAWAAGNIALHSHWQFRETVFLYAAHAHMAFFVFVVAGARWAQDCRRAVAIAYTAAAGLVAVSLLVNNLALYDALPRLS